MAAIKAQKDLAEAHAKSQKADEDFNKLSATTGVSASIAQFGRRGGQPSVTTAAAPASIPASGVATLAAAPASIPASGFATPAASGVN